MRNILPLKLQCTCPCYMTKVDVDLYLILPNSFDEKAKVVLTNSMLTQRERCFNYVQQKQLPWKQVTLCFYRQKGHTCVLRKVQILKARQKSFKKHWAQVKQIKNIKIVLLQGAKVLSVNSKFYKGMQPLAETLKMFLNLTSQAPTYPSSTSFCCTWKPRMLCARVALCLGEPYTSWSTTLSTHYSVNTLVNVT